MVAALGDRLFQTAGLLSAASIGTSCEDLIVDYKKQVSHIGAHSSERIRRLHVFRSNGVQVRLSVGYEDLRGGPPLAGIPADGSLSPRL